MPDLEGGIRRSKRLNKSQENPISLAPTAQRGAGRGNGYRTLVLGSANTNLVKLVIILQVQAQLVEVEVVE